MSTAGSNCAEYNTWITPVAKVSVPKIPGKANNNETSVCSFTRRFTSSLFAESP